MLFSVELVPELNRKAGFPVNTPLMLFEVTVLLRLFICNLSTLSADIEGRCEKTARIKRKKFSET